MTIVFVFQLARAKSHVAPLRWDYLGSHTILQERGVAIARVGDHHRSASPGANDYGPRRSRMERPTWSSRRVIPSIGGHEDNGAGRIGGIHRGNGGKADNGTRRRGEGRTASESLMH